MRKCLWLLALALCPATRASAEVILNTFGDGTYSGSITIGSFPGDVQGNFYEAITTNASAATLTSVSFAAVGAAPVTVTYALTPNGSGFDTSIALGTITPTDTIVVYTLTSLPTVVIPAESTIFLGFTTQSASTSKMEFGSPAISTPSYPVFGTTFTGPENQAIPAVELLASPTSVPEPSPWLLGLLATIAGAAIRRRSGP